ncbi:hypothetical protein DFH07DRAFT_315300 [Mycena maculata]|uniref:Uncharacterized protein n=1 Tax=Mycena maculata TaxID=230809 RepID=A0AAD7MJ60_9AGAR|nr:hypothetical protein DFH07DRAFT_315300 [Mycena maculata]
MLPEPETDPESIFEDKSDVDYADISISSFSPITSTQALELLVAKRKYDQALRVLDELLEVGTKIPFSFSYEAAALSAVKSPAATKDEMDAQVITFRKWFSLIPPADQCRPRAFRSLCERLISSPFNSLRLLMEFALIAAEKGFASSVYHRVTGVVSMYGDPDITIRYIAELRRRNRIFLERSSRRADADILDGKLHADVVGVAVRVLAKAGRFDHAVELVPDPPETHFHLKPYTYNFLVRKMQMTEDPRLLPHINFVAQHKSETRYRSPGLKKMHKALLGLAIRCLADVDQFDLAMGLLPHLEEAEAAERIPTLDDLLAGLQDAPDARYSAYIDRVSQLRQATDPIPLSATPSVPAETLEGQPFLPHFEGAEVAEMVPTLDGLPEILGDTADARFSDHVSQLPQATEPIPPSPTPAAPVETVEGQPPESIAKTEKNKYGRAIRALTRAWCLPEALALVHTFHRTNTLHETRTYDLLTRQLRASYNPKYHSDMEEIRRMRDSTKQAAVRAKREARLVKRADAKTRDEADTAREVGFLDFDAEDVYLSSSLLSERPRRLGNDLAVMLRALKKGFRALSPSHQPHPLTVVRFMELYLASGRTRAIPLLRNFVLRRCSISSTLTYVSGEMLFHARNRSPDLVIRTFVSHFYIVGIPRDELIVRLTKMERPPPDQEDIWASRTSRKLYPDPVQTAVVWRALLALTSEEHTLEALYAKLLQFADIRSVQESALHPGVPYLHPPPSWKTGVDASAFTPFIRRMCLAFGSERGALILSDMLRLGIKPNIYQLTELAMEYSRTGDVPRTLVVLNQVERAVAAWESAVDDAGRRRANLHVPRVDQVFYIAIVRGFLMNNKVAAARDMERKMCERYGYVAGKDQHLDELYQDLEAAERGRKVPRRQAPVSVIYNARYKALLENPGGRVVFERDLPPEPSNSAGA